MSITTIQADLESHHIEGRVADGRAVSVPLISHISGPLWMGGCVDGVELPHDFAFVISLYPWEQYKLGPRTAREEYRLYDRGSVPEWDQLEPIVRQTIACLRVGKTLVHCQAGLNRSGLISALAITLGSKRREGMAASIDLLRNQRSEMVLCNSVFEAWLRDSFPEAKYALKRSAGADQRTPVKP